MFENAFGYYENIPKDFREIFMWLCQDIASLYNMWDFYKELFGTKENSLLLAKLAEDSFIVIEEALRDSMTMAISRLNDPPQMYNKQNLSLKTLVSKCSNIPEITDLCLKFDTVCQPVIILRNKRIGHKDLITSLDPNNFLLTSIGKHHIDEILLIAGQIVNLVSLHYSESEICFSTAGIGGAGTLIYWLKKANSRV